MFGVLGNREQGSEKKHLRSWREMSFSFREQRDRKPHPPALPASTLSESLYMSI